MSGFPPTRAEIAERMGFRSVNAAEQHLRALEKKGAIEISSGASRGIRVRDGRPGARGGDCSSCRWSDASPPAARCSPRSTCRAATRSTRICSRRAPTICCACAGCRCATPAFSKATCSPCIARTRRAPDRSSSRALPTKSRSSGYRRRGHAVQLEAENPEFSADRSRSAARCADDRRHRGRGHSKQQEPLRSWRRRDNSLGFAYRMAQASACAG